MAKSDKERQALRRERMRTAGYKQVVIWVPEKSEGKDVKLERKMFAKRIEALTVGWSKSKLNRFFRDLLSYISERIKQGDI